MIPEDEELNFAITPDGPEHWHMDDPEPARLEEDLPLWLGAGRPLRPPQIGNEASAALGVFIALLIVIFIVANYHCAGPRPDASSLDTQASASAQPSVNSPQSSRPEYFPAGWDYVASTRPIEMQKKGRLYTIPPDSAFFVSLRNVNGYFLAVAKDGGWNGWVRITGAQRQIPMLAVFMGAKTFASEINCDLLASSNRIEAPSQAAAKTDPEVLRAPEAETERIDMSLFEKKEKEEPAEITVQGEEAFIPQPPESEQSEKKVKLPKTKWYAEGGASAPPFSSWRWVCMSRNGLRCGLQDVNGAYVQDFLWKGGSVRASAISAGALFPRGLVWGCAKLPATLYCTIFDSGKTNRQGCAYDGKEIACGN